MINYITYIPSFILALVLGIIILARRERSFVKTIFSLMILCVAAWVVIVLIADRIIISPPGDIIWARLTILGPTLMLPLLLIFSIIFPKNKNTLKKYQLLLISLPSIIILPFITSSLNIKDTLHRGWGGDIQPGPIYLIFSVYFVFYLLASGYLLFKKYRESTGVFKEQLKYILFGIMVSASVSILFSGILPLMNVSYFSIFSPPSVLIFIGATTYAIVRHRLLDIRLVISRSIIYF